MARTKEEELLQEIRVKYNEIDGNPYINNDSYKWKSFGVWLFNKVGT